MAPISYSKRKYEILIDKIGTARRSSLLLFRYFLFFVEGWGYYYTYAVTLLFCFISVFGVDRAPTARMRVETHLCIMPH